MDLPRWSRKGKPKGVPYTCVVVRREWKFMQNFAIHPENSVKETKDVTKDVVVYSIL